MSSDAPPMRLGDRLFDQSRVLPQIAERLETERSMTLVRATDAAAGFVLAYLSRYYGKSLVVLTASPDAAEGYRRDWSQFLDYPVAEFPMWESLFEEGSEPDPDTYRQRHEVVDSLASGERLSIVTPVQAVLQPVGKKTERRDRRLVLRTEEVFPPEDLARSLVDAGYRRFPQVARPGDFSLRGGIFDVFPREGSQPYRIDFFGDEIDSIRTFSLEDQRSRDEVQLLVLTLAARGDFFIRGFTGSELTLLDSLPDDTTLVLVDPSAIRERVDSLVGQWAPGRRRQIVDDFWARTGRLSHLSLEPLTAEKGLRPITLPVKSAARFQGGLERVMGEIERLGKSGSEVEVFFRQLAEVERFEEILSEHEVPTDHLELRVGEISQGFEWDEGTGGTFISGSALLGQTRTLVRRVKKKVLTRAVDSFLDLTDGDVVVHLSHGIGKYCGIREVSEGQRKGDHLVIEYREGVQVLVPAERIDLVQRYVGGGKAAPRLDRIGSKSWANRKAKVEEDIQDLAAEMIEVQAIRAQRKGYSYPPNNEWQREFEASFPFQETADQLSAMEAIREDLESEKPMDRLVCGDVGYGKTEVAMRAAFKVVQGGKQVAIVVPTTVLAQQHYVTFRDRMAEFPVRIEALSRLRSRKEQTEILGRAHEGKVDIVIGTHRLFSSDVSFKDIGLIVIDEEQRFGVAHKEKLKQLRRMVDVLTLTATPIPRTLHLALLGVKDISSLDEAPQGRSPIHTETCMADDGRFREIILRELNRDGQVYFLHNRVKSIKWRRQELEQLVPEARMVEVHGQMDEKELEKRMVGFINKEFDVLVCTTIIESGLDIPSANTLIVERADRFGLAEMHQLRGRVGRSQHKAYAYFVVPEDRPVGQDARTRLSAIEEYSQLGAGFQIAMRDLEIRGAGNILGKEQSGHIAVVGYDLYCRLLERAVHKLRGEETQEPPDVDIAIPAECRIAREYVSDETQRLRIYRSLATSLTEDAVADLAAGLEDRYGPIPPETAQLIELQRMRIVLGGWGARKATVDSGWLMLEGDANSLRASLRANRWEVVEPPGRALGARPPSGDEIQSLSDAATALRNS